MAQVHGVHLADVSLMPSHAVTVYYVPSCAFSVATVTFLILRGVNFRTVNIDEHLQERARLVRAIDRELETPTLEINEHYYVAPSLSELKKLLKPAPRTRAAGHAHPHAHGRSHNA